jgi:hypothetical protein
MMHETDLADPYMTPRTLPARRPFKFLAYSIILAVVLLSSIAIVFMFYRAASAKMQLDRAYLVNIPVIERGSMSEPTVEPPANAP